MRPTPQQVAAAARLFSSNVITELSRCGKSALFARLLCELQAGHFLPSTATVGDAFEFAFRLMKLEGLRHEYVYKAALTHKVLLGTHSLNTACMLTEFRTCECKADVVILNGTSTVYEIKSERDSLARLDRQISAYSKVFASVNVICSSEHTRDVLRMVPQHVGVLGLSRRYQITTLREAINDVKRIDATSIFDCLPVSEAKDLLKACGKPLPTVPNTLMRAALRAKFQELGREEVHAAFVSVLKQTRNLAPLAGLVEKLPAALHCAALSVQIRKMDRLRLTNIVTVPLFEALAWS